LAFINRLKNGTQRGLSRRKTPLTPRQSDFLRLTAFVLAQHGKHKRADALMRALSLCIEPDLQMRLARSTLCYNLKDYKGALALLEEIDIIDPIERFGQHELSEQQKSRRYMKARCYRELGQNDKMRDAIDIYLRRLARPEA
jgi:tetratricopeptide (TPR) repeat protein